MTSQQLPPPSKRDPVLTLTNLIKLGGFVLALHEGFTSRDPATFAVASFMLGGAQGVENIRKGRT